MDASTSTYIHFSDQNPKCSNLKQIATNKDRLFVFICALVSVIFIGYGGYMKNCELNQLRSDLNILRHDFELLKIHFKQDDLLSEISSFENEIDVDNVLNDSNASFVSDESVEQRKRKKREIIAYTADGVPIMSESYAEMKRDKNSSTATGVTMKPSIHTTKRVEDAPKTEFSRKHQTIRRIYPKTHSGPSTYFTRNNLDVPSPSSTSMLSRVSRVMDTGREQTESPQDKHTFNERAIKKFMTRSSDRNYQAHLDTPEDVIYPSDVQHNTRNRRRNRTKGNIEILDDRPHRANVKRFGPFIHLNGDASKYVLDQHQHYKGNGHLAHPQGLYVDWSTSSWTKSMGMERHFDYSNGVVTIHEPGLYFIYAQIFYVDEHDINGYRIYNNNRHVVAQCTITSPGATADIKENTCHTATVHLLHNGDTLEIRDLGRTRYSLFQEGRSFFGLFKLADAKTK